MKWAKWELRQLQRANEPRTLQIAPRCSFDGKSTKNAIKKYLWAHTRSRYLRVDYDEAALAVYLPVAQFQKGRPY